MSRNPKDFPESVKKKARELAAYKCCYCRSRPGDEVHHLIPQEKGGPSILDNAILLCAQCHIDYGDRRDKQKQLREARDHWYKTVREMYKPTDLKQLGMLEDLATKHDIHELKTQMAHIYDAMMVSFSNGTTSPQQVVNAASTMISSTTTQPTFSASGFNRYCSGCGRPFTSANPDDLCAVCGQRP